MAAFDKKRIRRELEQDRRKKARERLLELRGQIKEARERKKLAIRAVRAQCREARARLTAARRKLRSRCDQRREIADVAGTAEIAAAKRRYAQERADERILRGRPERKTRATAKERRAESDDAVRVDLPSELVPVFERVKRHIKGGPRKTRTEAFLEWVEDHTGEVAAMQAEDDEAAVRRMVAEHDRLERELARKRSAVPF